MNKQKEKQMMMFGFLGSCFLRRIIKWENMLYEIS